MRLALPALTASSLFAVALLFATAPRAQVAGAAPPPPEPSWQGGLHRTAGPARAGRPSAAEAYAYSAAATGGAVALGYALYRVSPGDPTGDSFTARDVGLALVVFGVVGGPSVGNAALGAQGDVRRAMTVKMVGVGVGAGLAAAAVASCFSIGDTPPTCESVGTPLFAGAALAVGAGLVVGTVYDLATIPENARPARPAVGGGVGLGPGGAPMASLHVGL